MLKSPRSVRVAELCHTRLGKREIVLPPFASGVPIPVRYCFFPLLQEGFGVSVL